MSESSSTESQSRPLLWVAALAFLILFSYGISRSAIDGLLQEDNGKGATKYAYALVALAVTLIIPAYSRAASRHPVGRVLAISSVLTAAVLALLLIARATGIPFASYALYIWKDVYVVILVELVWTLANSAFKVSTARWAYGFFCVAGTLGDMGGSYLTGVLTHSIGNASLLWLIVPTMVASALVGLRTAIACGNPHPEGKTAIRGVVEIVRSSRPIQLLLGLVAISQLVTTLIDATYLGAAYDAYPVLQERTALYADVNIAISLSSLTLQALSGAFVTLVGIRALLLALPILLGGTALYASVHPTFASLVILKVVDKSLGYSLFRTTKELLYRPLSYAEKTQGKGAVDVFGYRAAKGAASGLLVAVSGAAALVAAATAAGIGIWLVLAVIIGLRSKSNVKAT